MRKLILLISIIVSYSNATFAQNADDVWTKDAKTQLANECMSLLSAKYPNLPDDQKEGVAICYANAIQNAHPKRSEWINLMEIEVKKEKSNTLNQCVKSGGVEAAPKIEAPKAIAKLELNNDYLIGVWKFADEEYRFAKGNSILYKHGTTSCSGTWTLDGDKITIALKGSIFGKLSPCDKTIVLDVVSFHENEFQANDKKRAVDLTRGK